MRSPLHLWSGDWQAQSEEARARRAAERQRDGEGPEADEATEAPDRDDAPVATIAIRRPTRNALIALAVLLAVVAIAGYELGRGDGGPQTAALLPATPAGPLPRVHGQSRAGAIYALASQAVVSIRTAGATGTGFVIDRRGTIVTNAHVVVSAHSVAVRFGTTGRSLTGTVLGSDPSSDLAVLRIDPGLEPAGVKPLGIADSRSVRVGDPVIAIGNPFGLDRTETAGIVSGLGRTISAPNGFEIAGAIQTDAAINPGNSGGPLLNVAAQVVGVNSQIETGSTSEGNVGIGFAVPSNSIRQVVPALESGHHIARPWLGVSSSDAPGGGAVVSSVIAGGPAEHAGISPGDVIRSIDRQPIADSAGLGAAVAGHRAGDSITVGISRAGLASSLSVKLGERPAQVP